MLTAAQLKDDIRMRLGVCPSFYAVADGSPRVMESLWRQTEIAYLDNSLPALFKEKLFAYLSRFCRSPYSLCRHSAFLLGSGNIAGDSQCPALQLEEVMQLLGNPVPRSDEIDGCLSFIAEVVEPFHELTARSNLESVLVTCAVPLFLQARPEIEPFYVVDTVRRCQSTLRRYLGSEAYDDVVLLLSYIHTEHRWTESHPELSVDADVVQLLEENQSLADWIDSYPQSVSDEFENPRQRVADRFDGEHNPPIQQAIDQAEHHETGEPVNPDGIAASERAALSMRQAQRALNIRERVIESVSSGILITDPNRADNPVIYCNSAFCEMTGYDEAEVLDRNCRFLQRGDRDQPAIDEIRTAVQQRRNCRVELRNYRKTGEILWIDLTISPVFDEENRLTHFVGVQKDITARRLAEEQLRRTEADLAHISRVSTMGEMATALAHEVNQPLTAIANYAAACAALLETDETSREDLRDALTNIDEQARRAGDIVNQLKRFIGRTAPNRASRRIDELIREACGFLDTQLALQSVRLELDLDDAGPIVMVDSIQFQQVLVNLIQNATEAMQEVDISNRQIRISMASSADEIQIEVADRGKGISPDIADKLFEPYFSTKKNGLGMGLKISQRIVRAHGGELTAETHQDSGTTIRFTIPHESN